MLLIYLLSKLISSECFVYLLAAINNESRIMCGVSPIFVSVQNLYNQGALL